MRRFDLDNVILWKVFAFVRKFYKIMAFESSIYIENPKLLLILENQNNFISTIWLRFMK